MPATCACRLGQRVEHWLEHPGPARTARSRLHDLRDAFRTGSGRWGPDEAMALVPESDAIYVTFDIDVMDPSLCPGTQSPDPGGFTYLKMRAALRALARRGRIVGIDLVEVAPTLGPAGLTARTGAQLLIDFLTAISDGKEQ